MTRAEAKTFYAAASSAEDIRALCAGDLFFLLVYGMGREDVDCDWLYERCREVQAEPDGCLDLWARAHYKSTIITVGETIRTILNEPNTTIGIFSHTKSVARAFLKQIKREFEGNVLLQELFPHICPPGRGEKRSWSEDEGLVVVRDKNPKESTLEAWGLVDGMPTGKHFDILIYDDVVTPESVTTPEQIKKTTQAWQISLNLGATHGARRRMIGTRYHAADTYADLIRKGSVKVRMHAATDDGSPNGQPVFLSKEALEEKKRDMGPYVFACQMLQNPHADAAMGFKAEWFCRTDIHPDGKGMNRYLVVDPAGAKKKTSDYTVMWVVGLGNDGNYYVLDGIHDRLNLLERTDALFELHRKWQPQMVGYERYGMQADIEHIRHEMERRQYRFPLVELGGSMPKEDRIRRLVPLFAQERVWFPQRLVKVNYEGRAQDLVIEFREDEFLTFPVSAHDDMLDCLARILDDELGARFPKYAADMAGAKISTTRPARTTWR